MATVTLISSDGEQFTVDWDVLRMMQMFAPQDDPESHASGPIPLPNVPSSVLKKVLEYCEYHRNDPPFPNHGGGSDDPRRRQISEIGEWDQKFIQVDQEMLFEIILAANYLDIKGLLDVGCKTVATMIKGRSPEEIKRQFNIVNDFTPEEEAQIKRENEWAEDR
ncbi:hypothetical protein FRC06_010251 [Ceratobasidium sp. 370]|nr:hypothetical protein FRC06_010251 [Ceratobasidium sp. 370]